MKKVYIIAISGCETYCIYHICATEEIARRRFKELKLKMLREELNGVGFDIREYINKTWPENEREEMNTFHMEQRRKSIKMLADCKFMNPVSSIHDKPVCDIYELEE